MIASLALAFLVQAAAGAVLPATPVQTLLGQKLDVSRDLAPHLAVLVVGFTKASRDQTQEWSRRVEAEVGRIPAAQLYQVAVIADVPRLLRGMVIDRIRASIPKAMHSHFLLVLDRGDAWKDIASFRDKDSAYVVVLSRGSVAWRGQGPPTEVGLQALVRTLQSLAAGDAGSNVASGE
ncbi:MAG: hypothetical protein ABI968_02305 [Acidobacteriota bacterium]